MSGPESFIVKWYEIIRSSGFTSRHKNSARNILNVDFHPKTLDVEFGCQKHKAVHTRQEGNKPNRAIQLRSSVAQIVVVHQLVKVKVYRYGLIAVPQLSGFAVCLVG